MKQSLAEALNGQREEAHRAVGRGGSQWGTEMEFKNNLTWVWLVASSCLALRCKMARMAQGILSAIRGSQGLPCGYDREVSTVLHCFDVWTYGWTFHISFFLPHFLIARMPLVWPCVGHCCFLVTQRQKLHPDLSWPYVRLTLTDGPGLQVWGRVVTVEVTEYDMSQCNVLISIYFIYHFIRGLARVIEPLHVQCSFSRDPSAWKPSVQ